MVQPCYKCGQLVEEGRPFCPHCVAPQIRVVVAEPAPIAVPATPPDTLQPSLPASETVPVLAVPMTWSQAVKPAALAAVIGMILMVLRLYPLVAILVMGFLAVLFYRQGHPGEPIKIATGIRLGALSGLFCSGFASSVTAVFVMVPGVRSWILENLQGIAAKQSTDPNLQAALEQLKSPLSFEDLIVRALLMIALSILLAGAGGSLAAAILSRREKS